VRLVIYFGILSLPPHPFYGLETTLGYSFNFDVGLKDVGMFCVPCFGNKRKAMESPNQSGGWRGNLFVQSS
jgi:hypothetical protein